MRIGKHGRRILAMLARAKGGWLPRDMFYTACFGLPPKPQRPRIEQATRTTLTVALNRLENGGLIARLGVIVMATEAGLELGGRFEFDSEWLDTLDGNEVERWFDDGNANGRSD